MNMITKKEVEHIAKLARLELTEKEIGKMQKDLSSILDYFNVLKKAPKEKTGGKAADLYRLIRENRGIRKDEVVEKPVSLANNLVQAAPDKKENYIKVKSILQ